MYSGHIRKRDPIRRVDPVSWHPAFDMAGSCVVLHEGAHQASGSVAVGEVGTAHSGSQVSRATYWFWWLRLFLRQAFSRLPSGLFDAGQRSQ